MWSHTSLVRNHLLVSLLKMYLGKFEDTYFILQNKYLYVYEDSFRAKILRYDSPYLTISLPTPWPGA